MRQTLLSILVLALCTEMVLSEDAQEALIAAYKTAPQGYPQGKDERGIPYAIPDTSVWFRWHFYNEEAIERFEDVEMDRHVESYNPLEGKGVVVARGSRIKTSYVEEQVSEGEAALKVEIPAGLIQARKATFSIGGIAGGLLHKWYPFNLNTCSYWAHFRWFKCDFYNPQKEDLRVLISGAPMLLPPGRSVVALKTTDAVGFARSRSTVRRQVPIEIMGPIKDTVLYVDHARMEQEVPKTIKQKGKLFHFAAVAKGGVPLLWPGMTPIHANQIYDPKIGFGWAQENNKRRNPGVSLHNTENGICKAAISGVRSTFRVDLPQGRYVICIMATPNRQKHKFKWSKGCMIKVNGAEHVLIPASSEQEIRDRVLAGEYWDYRPGACVWEGLVKAPFYPDTRLIEAEADERGLSFEFPLYLSLRTLLIFPEAEKETGIKELGRLNLLMAESWDVAKGWVNGRNAEKLRYIGFHEESSHPEKIPEKLKELKLSDRDFKTGFKLFYRGLTEAVYPDSIPSALEVESHNLKLMASPGERECTTFSLLPLKHIKGIRLETEGFKSNGGQIIKPERVGIRVSRYHQKSMEYGHGGETFNYEAHFLIRRESLDLYPGTAKRVYVDIHVPKDLKEGDYLGKICITSKSRQLLAEVPVTINVPAIELKDPPVYYGTEKFHPLLKEFGFNTFQGNSYERATQNKYKGWVVHPYSAAAPRFGKKRISWNTLIKSKDVIQPLLNAGLKGDAPRIFLGGTVPGEKYNDKTTFSDFCKTIVKEFPQSDILGFNNKLFFFEGPDHTNHGRCWQRQTRTKGNPGLIEIAIANQERFWIVDFIRHSKEQMARFTFGFWLWKVKALGRFSTFNSHTSNFYFNSAKQTYKWQPYYNLLGEGYNIYEAFLESNRPSEVNPSRDLLLCREGIDDYRYVYTLEKLVEKVEKRDLVEDANVKDAKGFLRDLSKSLSYRLGEYYESRKGAYAENWYPLRDNPWTAARFDETRRKCAEHILALTKLSRK